GTDNSRSQASQTLEVSRAGRSRGCRGRQRVIGRRCRIWRVSGSLALANGLVLMVAFQLLFQLLVVCLHPGRFAFERFAFVGFLGGLGGLLGSVNFFLRQLYRFL